jgi:imidazolonepropionase-like amidohydrolase
MKIKLITAIAFCLSLHGFTQTKVIAVKNIAVIDVVTGAVKKKQTVIIEGNKIVSVNSKVRIPETATIIDGTGKWLIPGLWDMHAHALGRWDQTAPLYIANGVTGIRDMANILSLAEAKVLRQNVYEHKIAGPRFVNAARLLDGPQTRFPPVAILIPTKEYAIKVADSLKEEGVDFYKVYETLPREAFYAIIDKGKEHHLAVVGHVPASVTIDEAIRSGMKSIEHLKMVGGDGNAPTVIRDSIRNLFRSAMWDIANKDTQSAITKNQLGSQLAIKTYNPDWAFDKGKMLAENHVWITPTMVQSLRSHYGNDELLQNKSWDYMPSTIASGWRHRVKNNMRLMRFEIPEYTELEIKTVSRFHKAGVKLLAGTDANYAFIGNIPGFGLHEEMKLFVKAGLSNLEALQTATLNPAIFLEATDSLGTIESNKIADLVLLDANPLENISNTQKIYGVILNGRWFDRKQLDKMLEDVKSMVKSK